jgi:hypothetical protein
VGVRMLHLAIYSNTGAAVELGSYCPKLLWRIQRR